MLLLQGNPHRWIDPQFLEISFANIEKDRWEFVLIILICRCNKYIKFRDGDRLEEKQEEGEQRGIPETSNDEAKNWSQNEIHADSYQYFWVQHLHFHLAKAINSSILDWVKLFCFTLHFLGDIDFLCSRTSFLDILLFGAYFLILICEANLIISWGKSGYNKFILESL